MRLSHILSAFLLLSGLLAVACDPQSAALAARFPPIVRATHSDYRTPRWSPDGTVITYEVNSAPDAEVWVASVDGRPPRRVTDAGAYASQPDWSSDGKLIIYTGLSNKVAQLFTIALMAAVSPKSLICPSLLVHPNGRRTELASRLL